MIHRRLALTVTITAVAVTTAALAAVTTSAAGAPLPTGTDTHGVLARLVRDEVVVTFTHGAAARYRRIAGGRVQVGCVAIVQTTRTGAITEERWIDRRGIAPHRRESLRASLRGLGSRPDYCTVKLVHGRAAGAEIAVIPISERGAGYLDERKTVRDIQRLVVLTESPSGRPTSAARMQAITAHHVAPVSGPEQRPPRGHAAYWTNGSNEFYLGELSRSGALYFFESQLKTQVVTTNMLDWLSGQDDP